MFFSLTAWFIRDSQGKNSIVIVPTVFVNNVAERGGISTPAVLSTICAGYADGTEPEVCAPNVVVVVVVLCPYTVHGGAEVFVGLFVRAAAAFTLSM